MPIEVIMPKVDMDMASGKISAWHVAEGDTVKSGDPLFDIETDKAAMEVEAPGDGVLHHILAEEGAEIPIGAPVAYLYAEGEAVGEPPGQLPADAVEEAVTAAPEPVAEAAVASPQSVGEDEGLRATPLARQLARHSNVPLADLTGSGPRGRIQGDDVRAWLHRYAPVDRPAEVRPPRVALEDQAGSLSVTGPGKGTRSGTPVVFLHGFAADAASWAAIETLAASDRPCWKIELPNHGRSPRRQVDGFHGLAAEIRRAFDALDLETVHLVGHSLGGALALALADTRPRKLASLTLISPAGLGPDIDGQILHGIGRATKAESLAPWLRQLVADGDAISWNYVEAALAARRDPNLRAAQMGMAEVLFPDGTQGFDLKAALDRLEVPARMIWGKRDRVIPWKHALCAPGHVSLNLFDGLGHLPHIEDPESIARLLKASFHCA